MPRTPSLIISRSVGPKSAARARRGRGAVVAEARTIPTRKRHAMGLFVVLLTDAELVRYANILRELALLPLAHGPPRVSDSSGRMEEGAGP